MFLITNCICVCSAMHVQAIRCAVTEEYWLQEAKKLPFGGKSKIQCCGSTPSMIVNHTHKGYTGWCFRCSPDEGSKFHPHGELSIKQILERREATRELQTSPVILPRDFTTEIPDTGRVWLLKSGISQQLSSFYGIGYSKYYNRVILPVLKNGDLDAFVARAVDGEKPKYIARTRNPENALFISNPAVQFPTDAVQGVRSEYDIVLTEDILSAIRVGRFVASAAVLGTSLSDACIGRIERGRAANRQNTDVSLAWWEPQETHLRVAVWMDPDAAGKRAADKIIKKLELSGRSSVNIRTDKDPKYLSDREILKTLKDNHDRGSST